MKTIGLLVVGLVVVAAAAGPGMKGSEVDGYKNWTKVNPTAQNMSLPVLMLCAGPRPQDAVYIDPKSPHTNRFVTVYVNPVGRDAMMTAKNPRFPVGTVVVKEKLVEPTDATPELITVMIKRPAGYDPGHGNWEFQVYKGAGKELQEKGKLANCQSCHDGRKDDDYLFRSYLPSSIAKKLK
jgi:hypothetical protein